MRGKSVPCGIGERMGSWVPVEEIMPGGEEWGVGVVGVGGAGGGEFVGLGVEDVLG